MLFLLKKAESESEGLGARKWRMKGVDDYTASPTLRVSELGGKFSPAHAGPPSLRASGASGGSQRALVRRNGA